jgi:integrase
VAKSSFNFTDRAVARLPACPSDSRSKSKEYSDLKTPGLKLEVGKSVDSKSPHKSWRVKGTLNGAKFSQTIGSFPAISVEVARARALEIKASLEQGIDPRIKAEPEPVSTTFREFANGPYSEWAQANKRSFNADFSKLNVHLLDRWGDRSLASISRRDVEQYLLDLNQQGQATGKPYRPATLNRHLSFVSKLFGKAVDWGMVEKNPAKGIPRRKENNIKTTHLKADEVVRLFQALNQDRNKTGVNAIKLLALCGARTSEILQAQWADYDPKAATLFLRTTKSGLGRFLTLSNLAVDIIEDMKQYRSGKYIFPSVRDASKPYNNIKKPLARALKAAGLSHHVQSFTPHCLRHTYASLLATNGVSLYQIQALLGHSTATVTQRYAHLSSDGLRSTNQMVADLLADKKSESSAGSAVL